ncbi:unnamed protein product [Zymoseptoria tritici ST99CH_1A5]|uniref:DUF7918 domain-containing protein n=1 Tax=Zymoseptoria tritici ST99CH_1A5 TaxID=1276529 RepID=A0A1Y6LYH0_ZYMTR|nr:unnamed protein product [Zymoseptoria tritici ST99CH_1A5]
MIDIANGIEVIISPYNETEPTDPYHEWKAPRKNKKLFADGRNESYIEAVHNERFGMEMILHTHFDWHGAPQVQISVVIDGGTLDACVVVRRPSDWKTKPKALRVPFMSYYGKIDGQTRVCGSRFSELEAVDDPGLLSKDEEDMEVSLRGKILVTFQRGTTAGKRERKQDSGALEDPLVLPDKTNKVVALDNGRSHAVQMLDLGAADSVCFNPAFKAHDKGTTGEAIVFTLFYTTSVYLEIKEIKPVIPVISRPNIRGRPIEIIDDPEPVAQPLVTPNMTPATMIRIKEEIGEGNANGTQLIAHTETPAEAFDLDAHPSTAANSHTPPAVNLAGHAPVQVKEEFIGTQSPSTSRGRKRTVKEVELEVAEADWQEAMMRYDMTPADSPDRMSLGMTCMAKKRKFVESKLQLAKHDADE